MPRDGIPGTEVSQLVDMREFASAKQTSVLVPHPQAAVATPATAEAKAAQDKKSKKRFSGLRSFIRRISS